MDLIEMMDQESKEIESSLLFKDFEPGVLTQWMTRLFTQLRLHKVAPTHYDKYPPTMKPLLDVLTRGVPYMFEPGEPLPDSIGVCVNPDPKKVLVGFSSGKDSTAAAVLLQDQGYKPILFHVHGINRYHPYELAACQEVARVLDLPLKVVNVSQRGKNVHPDNPVKNQLILAMALEWGLENGILAHSHGNDFMDSHELAFSINFSDSIDMYNAFRDFALKHVPGFQMMDPIVFNETGAYLALMKRPEVIPFMSSCLQVVLYKERIHQANERKFGTILPGRCGTCRKCCVEYLHLALLGVEELRKDRILHCVEGIRKKLPMMYDKEIKDVSDESVIRLMVDENLISIEPLLEEIKKGPIVSVAVSSKKAPEMPDPSPVARSMDDLDFVHPGLTPVDTLDGVLVKREDMAGIGYAPPVSKIRGIYSLLASLKETGIDTVANMDTPVSISGVGISFVARKLGLQAVIYYPEYKEGLKFDLARNKTLWEQNGATVVPIVKPNHMTINLSRAKKDLAERSDKAFMIPSGLPFNATVDHTSMQVANVPRDVGTIVISCGSGTTTAGLLRGLKNAGLTPDVFAILAAPKVCLKMKAKILKLAGLTEDDGANLTVIDTGIQYIETPEVACPFPCNPYYDLKAWKWLQDNLSSLKGPVLMWNIGGKA